MFFKKVLIVSGVTAGLGGGAAAMVIGGQQAGIVPDPSRDKGKTPVTDSPKPAISAEGQHPPVQKGERLCVTVVKDTKPTGLDCGDGVNIDARVRGEEIQLNQRGVKSSFSVYQNEQTTVFLRPTDNCREGQVTVSRDGGFGLQGRYSCRDLPRALGSVPGGTVTEGVQLATRRVTAAARELHRGTRLPAGSRR